MGSAERRLDAPHWPEPFGIGTTPGRRAHLAGPAALMRVLMVDRAGAASIWYLMTQIAEAVGREGGEIASCVYDDGRSGPAVPTPGRVFRVAPRVASHGPMRAGLNLLGFARAFGKALRAFRPDVVHVNFCVPGAAASVVARTRRRTAVVSTCHEMPGSLAPALRCLLQIQNRASHRCFAVSATVASGIERATVVPNGVDLGELERLRLRPARAPRLYLACAGRIVPEKGQHVLLDAFSRLAPRYKQLDLLLIGDGPGRPALEQSAGRLQLADRVRITGWLPRDRALELLADAALVVVPSRSTQEGFCLVMLEALGLGKPVVASCIPLFANFVRPAWDVAFFQPDDPGDLAMSIAARLERGPTGELADLDAFSSDTMAAAYVAAYRALLPAA